MDMNLLVALDALLRDGSVVKAATRMRLSAPAMSRTLGRIRDAIGDPVFVRAGRGLVPTPRALAMRERVRALVDEGRRLLGPEVAVEPAQFQRSFTIRANDSAVVIFGPQLLELIRRESPGVVMRFVPEGDESVAALREGSVDIDLGVQGDLGPEVRVQTLYNDEFTLLVRAAGPYARGKLTLERFLGADHISASRSGHSHGPVDQWLRRKGLGRQVRVVVPTHVAAAALAAQSDAIALVPRSLARSIKDVLGLKTVAPPMPLPPIVIAQAWHPRFDADPVHTWLRKQLRDMTAELRQPVTAGTARRRS